MKQFETDLSDVKDSVDMAHNLIVDEKKERKENERAMKEELQERTRGINNYVQLIKGQSSDIKSLKEGLKHTNNKYDLLAKEQSDMKMPLQDMQKKVEESLGTVKFPVHQTIVAQKVWYTENENVMEVAKRIIHDTLNLHDVEIT